MWLILTQQNSHNKRICYINHYTIHTFNFVVEIEIVRRFDGRAPMKFSKRHPSPLTIQNGQKADVEHFCRNIFLIESPNFVKDQPEHPKFAINRKATTCTCTQECMHIHKHTHVYTDIHKCPRINTQACVHAHICTHHAYNTTKVFFLVGGM